MTLLSPLQGTQSRPESQRSPRTAERNAPAALSSTGGATCTVPSALHNDPNLPATLTRHYALLLAEHGGRWFTRAEAAAALGLKLRGTVEALAALGAAGGAEQEDDPGPGWPRRWRMLRRAQYTRAPLELALTAPAMALRVWLALRSKIGTTEGRRLAVPWQWIADRCGASRRSITAALGWLQERGWIETCVVVRDGRRRANRYRLLTPAPGGVVHFSAHWLVHFSAHLPSGDSGKYGDPDRRHADEPDPGQLQRASLDSYLQETATASLVAAVEGKARALRETRTRTDPAG